MKTDFQTKYKLKMVLSRTAIPIETDGAVGGKDITSSALVKAAIETKQIRKLPYWRQGHRNVAIGRRPSDQRYFLIIDRSVHSLVVPSVRL